MIVCDVLMFVTLFQTLTSLVRGIFRKTLSDFGFDVINLLMGFDNAETQMQVYFLINISKIACCGIHTPCPCIFLV